MQLSKNLTLSEACVTSSMADNTPSQQAVANLKQVAEKVFQKCRDHFNKPLRVNSGYRSHIVNKNCGGAFNSQHLTGQALDLDFGNKADNKALFDYIRHNLMFDQCINEMDYSWIHCSYNGAFNRREVLEMKKVNGKSKYTKL